MQPPGALRVALALIERPAWVRCASRMPLPSGMTFLLEIAVGDETALHSAHCMTTRSQQALQAASAFFIEQVLFAQDADSYRVLGCRRTASRRELRRHMALLIRWLHPDGREPFAGNPQIDRSVFVRRVTQAWDDLKDDNRRTGYDQMLTASSVADVRWSGRGAVEGRITPPPAFLSDASARKYRFPRLTVSRVETDTMLSRLLCYFRRHA